MSIHRDMSATRAYPVAREQIEVVELQSLGYLPVVLR